MMKIFVPRTVMFEKQQPDRSLCSGIAQARLKGARRFSTNAEPSLAEIVDDPIFHRLLASDRLKIEDVLGCVNQARQVLTRS